MNSCVLMAKIFDTPQLRYTKDGQRCFTEVLVQFEALRPDEPPATLKVVGWGNLATEMIENYAEGNWVIIEGRLSMNRIERKEGFKETRAELVVSHIYRVDGQVVATVPASASTVATPVAAAVTAPRDNVVAMNSFKSKQPELDRFEEEFNQPSSPPSVKQAPRQPVTPAVSSPLNRFEEEFDQPSSPPPVKQAPRQPVTPAASSPDDQDLDDIPFMRAVSLRISEVDLSDSWELEANRPGTWLHGVADLWQ